MIIETLSTLSTTLKSQCSLKDRMHRRWFNYLGIALQCFQPYILRFKDPQPSVQLRPMQIRHGDETKVQ